MDLQNFEDMDSIMLMSIVNMKLRDDFDSLDQLVKFFDIDKELLIKKLADADFEYLAEVNQFR